MYRERSRDHERHSDRAVKQPGTRVVDGDITILSNDNDFKSNPIAAFEELELPQAFFKIFQANSYSRPTKIQSIAIPIALESFDIIGIAKTGSGKTLSFVMPILMAIEDEKRFCIEKGKVRDSIFTLGI